MDNKIKHDLKVGEKVKVIEVTFVDSFMGFKKGDEGSVTRILECGCCVDVDIRGRIIRWNHMQLARIDKVEKESLTGFKKTDLKDGMIVFLRNHPGPKIVIGNYLNSYSGFESLDNYDNDLRNKNANMYDIIKVYDTERDCNTAFLIAAGQRKFEDRKDRFSLLYEEKNEQQEEPKIDWSNVEVDTPIYVRDSEGVSWEPRHFSKLEDGKVFAWSNGCTSFSTIDSTEWKLAKLVENKNE